MLKSTPTKCSLPFFLALIATASVGCVAGDSDYAPPDIDSVSNYLKSQDRNVRYAAAEALSQYPATAAKLSTPLCETFLGEKDESVAAMLLCAIRNSKAFDEKVKAVIPVALKRDKYCVFYAVNICLNNNVFLKEATEKLPALLESKDSYIRSESEKLVPRVKELRAIENAKG